MTASLAAISSSLFTTLFLAELNPESRDAARPPFLPCSFSCSAASLACDHATIRHMAICIGVDNASISSNASCGRAESTRVIGTLASGNLSVEVTCLMSSSCGVALPSRLRSSSKACTRTFWYLDRSRIALRSRVDGETVMRAMRTAFIAARSTARGFHTAGRSITNR